MHTLKLTFSPYLVLGMWRKSLRISLQTFFSFLQPHHFHITKWSNESKLESSATIAVKPTVHYVSVQIFKQLVLPVKLQLLQGFLDLMLEHLVDAKLSCWLVKHLHCEEISYFLQNERIPNASQCDLSCLCFCLCCSYFKQRQQIWEFH